MCRKLFGTEFESACTENLNFSELLFADDTLIFAEPGRSLDSFLWAVQIVSSVYGLNLNRSKCARISLKTIPNNQFFNGEDVPNENKTDYLGAKTNAKADPAIEVHRRVAGARYVWQQLKDFWREGLLSKRQKILIYDALVGSKLLYSLHTLPLKNDLLNKLDVFNLKGLRQILGLETTFIERANTNEKVLKLAEAEINNRRKGGGVMKRVRRISEIIEDRSIQELGEVLRLDNSDPRRMVTFLESTAAPNLRLRTE